MSKVQTAMREAAARLLREDRVALVLGYEAGSAPFKTAPAFVERAEDVDRLVWGPFCTNNLAVYLPQVKSAGRVALIAKGCDARSAVTLMQEHQVAREQVVILGVPCGGMIDVKRLASHGSLPNLAVREEADGRFTLESGNGHRNPSLADVMQERCRICEHHVPAVADELLGEPVSPIAGRAEPFAAVAALEGKSPVERQAFWRAELSRCIRCYACRAACPACYCRTCFADKAAPRWLSKANTTDENWMFHAVRAFHLAGRCVQCGECERACPMHLPVSRLMARLDREVRERFGYVAGLDPAAVPPLGTFQPDDPDPGGAER